MGVHSRVFWEFSVVAMATAVMNKSKTAKKICISMILRHDFPQVHTHVDQYGYIILTSWLLINSLILRILDTLGLNTVL